MDFIWSFSEEDKIRENTMHIQLATAFRAAHFQTGWGRLNEVLAKVLNWEIDTLKDDARGPIGNRVVT